MVQGSTGMQGYAGDWQYNSKRLGNARAITEAMAANPRFRQYVEANYGNAEGAARAPHTVKAIDEDAFDFGERPGGGDDWRSGGQGGFGGMHKSPYQTDWGRLMMASYMAQLAW